jgi:hypothetical protein
VLGHGLYDKSDNKAIDGIQSFDHEPLILRGTRVTNRGARSPAVVNHVTRTKRPSGAIKGPSILNLMPNRVWYDVETSFATGCAMIASGKTPERARNHDFGLEILSAWELCHWRNIGQSKAYEDRYDSC